MKINVKNAQYTILFVDALCVSLDSGGYQGRVDYVNEKIYIANNLSEARKKEVLIHEITHAFLNKYKHQRDNYTEEDVCELFELFADDIVNIVNDIIEAK